MSGASYPAFFKEPFANAAGGSYITNPIPDTTGTAGAASLNQGFPPSTMTPESSSGLPPNGQDFNGILYMISSHQVYAQSGAPYLYKAAVSTALSGYAVGTILGMVDGSGLWMNLTAGNTTDPDGGSSAGWVPVFNYGYAAVTLAGSDVTLTPAQARRPVIVLTGTLTANRNLILPTTLQSWLIVNGCTGAFTVTAKTSAGTGVVIPAGGYAAPVGVYGNGTNIYPTVSPLSYPIDTAATPTTLALRDSSGQINATKYNQSSALENPTVGAVFVQNTGADGYLRKISIANLMAQMLLQSIGGTLTTGQISQAAVGQYFTQTLNANPLNVLFPQGSDSRRLQIQAGRTAVHTTIADGANYSVAVAFSPTFTATPFIVGIPDNSGLTAALGQIVSIGQVMAENAAGFTYATNNQTGGPSRAGTQYVLWVAVGY